MTGRLIGRLNSWDTSQREKVRVAAFVGDGFSAEQIGGELVIFKAGAETHDAVTNEFTVAEFYGPGYSAKYVGEVFKVFFIQTTRVADRVIRSVADLQRRSDEIYDRAAAPRGMIRTVSDLAQRGREIFGGARHG